MGNIYSWTWDYSSKKSVNRRRNRIKVSSWSCGNGMMKFHRVGSRMDQEEVDQRCLNTCITWIRKNVYWWPLLTWIRYISQIVTSIVMLLLQMKLLIGDLRIGGME